MNRLDGKVAVITGGARGMGAATADLFVQAGAQVVITDIDTTDGNAMAASIGQACTFWRQDVTSQTDWSELMDFVETTYGALDVLVNNAGIFRVLATEDTDIETWNRLVAVNQTGTFLGIQSAVQVMKRIGTRGSIINLSSIAGLAATPRAPAYAATKWAVRGLTKSAAVEFASLGIRVNSVHPGLIDTRMMQELDQTPEERDARVPLGRQGTVEEIAKLILFLASDDSSYCTGHEFVADGALKA